MRLMAKDGWGQSKWSKVRLDYFGLGAVFKFPGNTLIIHLIFGVDKDETK